MRPCNVAAEEFSLAAMLRDDLAAAQEADQLFSAKRQLAAAIAVGPQEPNKARSSQGGLVSVH